MVPDPTDYELSVEQELPAAADGAPRRARLTARLPGAPNGAGPDEATLVRTLRDLSERLAQATAAAGSGGPGRAADHTDRPLSELLETYRPRQPALIEALHADGELSDVEYELLRANLSEGTPAAPRASVLPPAAPPPARPGGRPVEELLRAYEITSLRQAGAVRARRQISFEEYMSLKRHFAGTGSPPEAAP